MPVTPKTESKISLRRRKRAQRRNISSRQRKKWDQSISRFLQEQVQRRKISSVAAFWPFDGEPDLMPALKTLSDQSLRIALPVIDQAEEGKMTLHQWSSGTSMMNNRFGIPEPLNQPELALENIEPLFSKNAIIVFKLSLQGMTAQQIADQEDMTFSTVNTLKSRVKSRFKSELDQLRQELE